MAQNLRRFGIPPEAIIEDVVVDYQHPLGGGSDATVYSGTWTSPVAVKALHPELIHPGNLGRETFMTRFGQECLRLRALRHENIVQFMGVCTTRDGGPGLVTEKMAETLEQRYKSEELSEAEQLDIFCDIAAGISHLHAQGVVHRDLTARNVLLTERARGGIAKVADMGLSLNLDNGSRGRDELSQCPGSRLYMPPEAFAKPPTYNEKLDVFSFGVLMMSTIARRDPSGDLLCAPRSERQADGREREIPETERRAADYDSIPNGHPVKRLIGECLQNDPSTRPSAKELLEELALLRGHQPPGVVELRRRPITSCLNCHHMEERFRHFASELAEARPRLVHRDNLMSRQRTSHGERAASITREDSLIALMQSNIEKDSVIADLETAKEKLEERLIIERAHLCNYATAGLFSRARHTDFPKWQKLTTSPLPADINDVCCTTVRNQQLFVASRSRSHGCMLWCTTDAKQWFKCRPPPNSYVCEGLVTHDNHLYCLANLEFRVHCVLFELTVVDTCVIDAEGYMHAVWQELPNGCCPIRQFHPSVFIDKRLSRIVIIGGRKSYDLSTSDVSEYCLIRKNWTAPAHWPALPSPRNTAEVVCLRTEVLLLGGELTVPSEENYTALSSVLTAEITNGNARQWRSNVVPDVPCMGCGASKLFSTVAVAGGASSTLPQNCTYILDRSNATWIKLPSMQSRRVWPALVYYQDHLLAIGGHGVDWGSWLPSMEKLPVSYFSIY